MYRDFKYLLAYLLPISAVLGIYLGGWWSLGSIYVAFGILPALELILPKSSENAAPETEAERARRPFFDFLLYLNLPILYAIVALFLTEISFREHTFGEQIAMTFSVGLLVGTMGINVGHELGHRLKKYEQQLAKLLLLPGLYLHFFIEHNRGHHKHVATEADPASARLQESIYAFWLRSVTGGYRSAWQLELERLRRMGKPTWSWQNAMVRYTLYCLLYLLSIGLIWGWSALPFALGIAVVGFLLLESVNYIEHYGLSRQRLPSGQYEKVGPHHSWNSDHELGRIFLYELTRHSDHHFRATRKYQILRHFEQSPQLPLGYPASILVSLVPPLWFKLIHPHLPQQHPAAVNP